MTRRWSTIPQVADRAELGRREGMEIFLILLIVIVAGVVAAVTRMPKGRATGNPTVDDRTPGSN